MEIRILIIYISISQYLSTWGSFILSVLIFADCHLESLPNREESETNQNDTTPQENEEEGAPQDVEDIEIV